MSTQRARQLRQSLTTAEVRLWSRLKRLREHGFHFRRQAPFRGYYLDFVCHSRRLVVELDGWRHAEDDGASRDAVRDRVVAQEGFRVLRFWNREVDESLDRVMDAIVVALQTSPPWPLRGRPSP